MPRIDNDELVIKAQNLARILGRHTSLVSDPETAADHCVAFKEQAQHVRARYKELVEEVSRQKHLTHEIESIFDNFFVVEAAIFEIRNNIRKDDFSKFPLIETGKDEHFPRVYHILSKLVRETNRVMDRDLIEAFLKAYQEYNPLSIRELYAIPSILQVVFVENFGKLIDRAIASLKEYEEAATIAKKIRKEIAGKKVPYNFSKIISGLATNYSIVPLSLGFYLFQNLSQEAATMRPVLRWLKLNFEKQGIDTRDLIDLENKQRSENSVVASNIIESLHWLTQARWENIVEDINIVDSILSKDPAGAYADMDLESKNHYRRVIVRMAEAAGIHEAEVARTAIKLASQNAYQDKTKATKPGLDAMTHAGYYLIDKGRVILEDRISYKPKPRDLMYRFVTENNTGFYFGIALSFNLAFTYLFAQLALKFGLSGSAFVATTALAFLLNTEVSFGVLNTLIARFLPVRKLPSLDLASGISDRQRTFVIIPTMLRSEEAVRETVRKLEVRYLGNREDNILYALLFGFKDADQETTPGDDALVQAAMQEVEALNAKYSSRERKFYMLYRKRVWNEKEGKFMEWERKRGKLREFNQLLRGKTGTTFINENVLSHIPHVRYVITLDEDTELPRDAARKLIGCIDHPLNRPVYSPEENALSRGYGIIQPRVSVRLATATKSFYSRIYSATSGIDSYSTAVSDLYQDLFGNALFFGKGIYDVDAVEKTMEGQIPDNTVLSHDLLEGIYARTGYASNVVLFDGFPKFYHEFAVRLHRWIRGDWQIVTWIAKVHKPESGTIKRRAFSFVDRFKIFDNLRRSLVPVIAISIVPFSFKFEEASTFLGVYVCVALGTPYFASLLSDILSIKRIPLRIRLKDTVRQTLNAFSHTAFRVVFLLHQAYVSLGAVILSMFRLFITKRKLLEWQISTDVGVKFTGQFTEFYKTMFVTQVVAIIYLQFLNTTNYVNEVVTGLFSLWLVSPVVAYIISIVRSEAFAWTKEDERMLRSIAYRTARYFLDLSRRENNWLIQDHFQEQPKLTETERLTTSPTNLGMLMTALLSSYELGFLPFDRFLDRSQRAFISLSKLQRFKGHLLNWYDIEKLETLSPAYLSSVDSANFVMALIAFRRGVHETANKPVLGESAKKGIEDALYSIVEESRVLLKTGFKSKASKVLVKSLNTQARIAYERAINEEMPITVSGFYKFYTEIHPLVVDIERVAVDLRAEESIREAGQALLFVEQVARLIEEGLAFQRYILPHIHNRNFSIDIQVAKDAKLKAIYGEIQAVIEKVPTLVELGDGLASKLAGFDFHKAVIDSGLAPEAKEQVVSWFDSVEKDLSRSKARASEFLADVGAIEKHCSRFIHEPDFSFLYNKERGLFHIGYNVTYDRIDSACYNFLASESNSVSFVAILKNQVPQKHWFYLGRKLVRSGSKISLVSWGGSLFEYLTSLIYFKAHKESLLGTAASSAISIHRKHGLLHRTPWGMGESAYYLFDAGKHYQYQVFGSPEIGLKRGLADYLVVAPYVSALALSFVPNAAISNMKRLSALGGKGGYGFYDALDYMNEDRVKASRPYPTRVYYAHHQGFTLLGIHNTLDKDRIRNLFHSDPEVAALEILLEEKMPSTPAATTLSIPTRLSFAVAQGVSDDGKESKQYVPSRTHYPYLAFIGNDDYSVTISNAGSGQSKYKRASITRFREDPLLEESGMFFYLKNEKTKTVWSPTNRPLGGDVKKHRVIYHENKAQFEAVLGSFSTKLEVTVHPTLPVEIRTLSITNTGTAIEKVTAASYGETVLSYQSQDLHHPHYQRMLVESSWNEELNALIYSRPHPSDRTKKLYFAHMLAQNGFFKEKAMPCADRELFIGKGRSFRDPAYFERTEDKPIRQFTLDPIFSLSKTINLKPGQTEKLVYLNIANEDREELVRIMRKFRKARISLSTMALALSSSASTTKKLGISQDMAVIFQELASKALGGKMHDEGAAPVSNLPLIHSLWKLGISGDYPLVVVIIKDIEDVQIVKHALLCHSYWKHKGIQIDIVILNQEPASYIKVLDDEIDFLLRQSKGGKSDVTGSAVHHVKSDLVSELDKKVLMYVSRVILDSKNGTFKQQVRSFGKSQRGMKYPARHVPTKKLLKEAAPKDTKIPSELLFKNDWGGFDPIKSEYVMSLTSNSLPLAPWSNVIAQPEFGTVVTESGSMFTWSKDSYDNRLTAWNNESLVYKSSEIVYLRDEETGEVWNPTPLPVKSKIPYTVRHGKGYTTFEHKKGNLDCVFNISVSLENPVKIASLTVKNTGTRKRIISETVYLEPAMNVSRDHTRDFIAFERDQATGALFFKQAFRNQLPNRVAFADLCNGAFDLTTDKAEFIGRHGSFEMPMSLRRAALSQSTRSSTMNCAALQSIIEIEPGEERTITFILGDSDNKESAGNLVRIHREKNTLDSATSNSIAYWKDLTGMIQIETPDKALDALFNHQLLYQSMSARIWGKTGYYQPSGAFGFRDQLQDMTAFVWSRPQDVRAFILKAAAHQFKEGDALNWWHDHNNFGVRTVLSDHQLWLVYTTLEYVSVTGDYGILDVEVPFLEGSPLNFTYQREWAGTPATSSEVGTLYEHCVRALNKSTIFGAHGIPLIGMSDWNDGLSRAGVLGKGESVWTGWFLSYLLNRFSKIANKRGDNVKAEECVSYADAIGKALERHAWDGKWYRRAFLDSGIILGSKKLNEFRIDSIAQSWAALSGIAKPDRKERAMQALMSELYDGTNMKLLTPPLRESLFDPGYIKDYPPGVRENGSQYNHAALWAAQALFKEGHSDDGKKILDLVNSFKRTDGSNQAREYRSEPYVVASDVFAEPSYKGRGGWTWYTGSAGVMYKAILQFLLGVHVEGDVISFAPSLPTQWTTVTITYKKGAAVYLITYVKPLGVNGVVSLVYENDVLVPENKLRFVDDGKHHAVRVVLVEKPIQE